MKRYIVLFMIMVGWIVTASAQSYPMEWTRYMSDSYLSVIECSHNDQNLSESEFKNQLLNTAYANLSKKVNLEVREVANLDKQSINGYTQIGYTSSTDFSTQADMKLVDSKSMYDARSQEGCVVVYIDKYAARTYYKNTVEQIINKVDNAVTTANNYVVSGFKDKARNELKSVEKFFSGLDEPFFWLNFLGMNQAEMEELLERCNVRQRTIKQMLADLTYGTRIFLSCAADLFGQSYENLGSELKAALASNKYSFTDDPMEADWIVEISVKAREYNTVVYEARTAYFAYVDAKISIDKTATMQRIYENEISVKGGHTRNYKEAGRSAYVSLSEELEKLLKRQLKG